MGRTVGFIPEPERKEKPSAEAAGKKESKKKDQKKGK